ncbi:MAG: TatD family hydrolase [Alistipes sp.]|nr:TatD family hydrolase [Alistipes sp.]
MHFVNIHTHRPTGRHIEPSAAGIHPWYAADTHSEPDGTLSDDAQAVGETGLDFACSVPHELQEKVFREQLAKAAELRKPVILHCVRAFEPTMKILNDYHLRAVIFHGFIGSPQQAARAIAKGCCISFGESAFRSPKTLEAMKMTPLQNLFLETDDSQITIEEVYARAAEVKGVSVAELQASTYENYKRIFQSDEQ